MFMISPPLINTTPFISPKYRLPSHAYNSRIPRKKFHKLERFLFFEKKIGSTRLVQLFISRKSQKVRNYFWKNITWKNGILWE